VVRAGEVPVMTGPEKGAAAGRGHLRAGDADRERVIEVLKAAFVQGRLDHDELDSRVGQVFTSRTYAELAVLTADIPARQADARQPGTGLAGTGPSSTPARTGPSSTPARTRPSSTPARTGPSSTPARTLGKAARRAGLCLLAAFALVGVMALTNMEFFAALAFYGGVAAVIAASGFLGYGVVDAWQERRARGQLPPRPGRSGRGLDSRQAGRAGHDPSPSDGPADRTRADLRARRPQATSGQLARPGLGWAAAHP
jgi:hypothetical protein